MILHALKEYYDRKSALPDSGMAPYGLEWKEIPYIVVLDETGKPVNIDVTTEGTGKSKRARAYLLPHSVKRGSNIAANLLWDNPEYALGIPLSNKAVRDAKTHEAHVAKKHEAFIARVSVLAKLDCPPLAVLLKFLSFGNKRDLLSAIPQRAEAFKEMLETGGNVSFKIAGSGELIAEHPLLRNAVIGDDAEDAAQAICLVTGEKSRISRLHTAIKGVWGAQSSGANIVSFNLPAFSSYNKEQGDNAPVGDKAEFAYTTALNHLLGKDSSQRMQVGDATTVFWASGKAGEQLERSFALFFGLSPKDDPDRGVKAVASFLTSVKNGDYGSTQTKENRFYVLGLSPNASRLSIRLWVEDTVAGMSEKVARHFTDTKICHSPREPEYLPLFSFLVSVAANGKADNIPPSLAGEMMRAILEGLPYPQTLLKGAIIRIRAERDVTYPRAALIKACINRSVRYKNKSMEEELKVSLDKENRSAGYLLGRLFAALEKIQEEANGTATIRERFYGAASGTPVVVFGNLMRLKNHHLAKLTDGRRIYFEKLIGEIHDGIGAAGYPAHLPLADQGRFAIGYYHQKQAFYTKQEEK